LPEFVAEQVEKLLGSQICQVVGDFELADAGGEAMAKIAGFDRRRRDGTWLWSFPNGIEVEKIQ
jgi:hypothetical protein